MILDLLDDLAEAITTAGCPCVPVPTATRPTGLHAWVDAPTLVADDGVLCGEIPSGAPDLAVTVHLRAGGADPAPLYDALLPVLTAVPAAWWLSDDVTPEPVADDGTPFGYAVRLTTRRP